MGCDDGGEFTGKGVISTAAAAAETGGGGLAAGSVSIFLGTGASSSPLGLVAERSSIQAVGWLLMLLGVGRVWLERPAHSSDQPDASKDPLVSPSFLDTPLSEEETSGRCLCCVCGFGFV